MNFDDLTGVFHDEFWTLHGPDGHAVHLPDPERHGKAVVPIFDTPASAVGVLLHIAQSTHRHADEIGLARWRGRDLDYVLRRAVDGDRSVVLVHDVDERVMVSPDMLKDVVPESSGAHGTVNGQIDRWFDLNELEWREAASLH